jgi:hypothetical protein
MVKYLIVNLTNIKYLLISWGYFNYLNQLQNDINVLENINFSWFPLFIIIVIDLLHFNKY